MRKAVDAEDVRAAVDAVLLALGAACWIACGSTPNVPARLRPATSAALRSVVAMAVATTGRFVREAKEKGHRLETGRAGPELSKELRALETACREMRDDYEGAVAAGARRGIPLDPARLSLPEAGVTGRLDLSPYLSPPLRRAYRKPSSLMRHPKEQLPASFAEKYSPTWGRLLERLDRSEILQLAPGPAVPRGPTGEDLRASVFAVRKDEDSDRSILNRQRRNAVEERVDGVTPTFPHGSLVGEISLREGEKLRVSADDLPDYYHTLAVTAERARTNAFGPTLSVAEAKRHCGRAWTKLSAEDQEWAEAADRVATLWGAVPMGDGNAVSFSQEGHANILSAGGCMRPEDLLVYQRPVPLGPVAEGTMVDDHVVLGKVPRDAKREDALAELAVLESADDEAVDAAEGDVGVLARSLRAYDRAGLRPKAAKSVRFADDADIWGATVFGEAGVVRGKTSVLWRAFYVSLAVLRLKRTTIGLARALIGLWTHVMTFCRPGFALLSRCYEWLQEAGEPQTAAERRAIRRVPGRVQDELRLLLAFAPHFERDLRGGFSPLLACTDASSTLAATVSAPIDEAVQEALWVHRIQKRGYVRILEAEEAAWRCAVDDGDEHTAGVLGRVFRFGEAGPPRKKGEAICPWAEDLVEGLDWDHGAVFRTKRTEHINVSEARAVGAEIDLEAADPRFHRTKGVFGVDSNVVAGAGSKGRSPSRMLNRPLRRMVPTLLLTRMQRGFVHLRSEFNPADDPTRRAPLRQARKSAPAWAAAARSRGTVALEEAYPELAGRRGAVPGVFRHRDDYAPGPEETDGEARVPGPDLVASRLPNARERCAAPGGQA